MWVAPTIAEWVIKHTRGLPCNLQITITIRHCGIPCHIKLYDIFVVKKNYVLFRRIQSIWEFNSFWGSLRWVQMAPNATIIPNMVYYLERRSVTNSLRAIISQSGWANAAEATSHLLDICDSLGIQFNRGPWPTVVAAVHSEYLIDWYLTANSRHSAISPLLLLMHTKPPANSVEITIIAFTKLDAFLF